MRAISIKFVLGVVRRIGRCARASSRAPSSKSSRRSQPPRRLHLLPPGQLDEAWNPAIRLLRAFEPRTGIGAVLNTSFNLHGEPLVCSPDDALDTFERSGLPHLALRRWVISKE